MILLVGYQCILRNFFETSVLSALYAYWQAHLLARRRPFRFLPVRMRIIKIGDDLGWDLVLGCL